jgi:hypothetical protein
LQKKNADIYIKDNNFQEIHYTAPGEKEIFATLLTAYQEQGKKLNMTKATPAKIFTAMQTLFQEAIAKLHTNTDLIQSNIQKQMERNHTTQLWLQDWKATTNQPESTFALQTKFETTNTSSKTLSCLQRGTEVIAQLSPPEAQMMKEASRLIRQKSLQTRKENADPTTPTRHNFSEMGQFFFKQDKLKDPDTIAALRTLALGKP